MGCTSASTAAWLHSASAWTAPSIHWRWSRAPPRTPTLVTDLIVGLRERGLDVTRPILVVLDGSKALRRAVRDVFDHPVIQRCQLHKIRNVRDRLPDKLRSVVTTRMRRGRHAVFPR